MSSFAQSKIWSKGENKLARGSDHYTNGRSSFQIDHELFDVWERIAIESACLDPIEGVLSREETARRTVPRFRDVHGAV